MDSNYYNRRPRKRVTRKMARRRQLTALAVILILLIVGIALICNACSKNNDDKGDTKPSVTTTTTTTTTTITTTTTTTVPVVTADPNDPNTITGLTLDKYSVDVQVGEKDMPWVTMTPASSTEKGEIWVSSDPTIATVDHIGNITGVSPGSCFVTVTSENNPAIYAEVKVTVYGETGGIAQTSETPTNADTTEAPSASSAELTYINGILIANKTYALPADYAPGLDKTTESQFNALSAAAAAEGLNIWLASGYRDYNYQKRIYNNYSSIYGSETADTFSARPGHSEHQTGLAIDVNSIDDSFAGTPEAEWLAVHAHEYGFIIRYPKGKEHITGYKYEPWHIRYLGVDTATKVYNSGLTLEEYLGITSSYQ
ncbi:MAG: D-alanyl-D-alanine carboxypeptidase family protein [Ruminococcus sp.]|nr:D-alanyl-D-alanine carboxypeptidase family protein [Ruminococcus sp.]